MRSPQSQPGQSDLNLNKAFSKFMFAVNAIKDYHQISAIAKMLRKLTFLLESLLF
jgi:hypothetical protein